MNENSLTKEVTKCTYIAKGSYAEGRRQKLRESRVSTIKNILITLALAIRKDETLVGNEKARSYRSKGNQIHQV